MKMKKIVLFVLTVSLFLALTACGGDPTKDLDELVKNESIAGIHLNDTKDTVTELLGDPKGESGYTKDEQGNLCNTLYYAYSENGQALLTVDLYLKNKGWRVCGITSYTADYAFSSGVGCGSGEDEIFSAYAVDFETETYESFEKNDFIVTTKYSYPENDEGIIIYAKSGKVTRIGLSFHSPV